MLKIKEIFYSIQGEGPFSGTPAVFIRFAGCNLSCSFCDTDFGEPYMNLSVQQIYKNILVAQHPTRLIVITGGEPFLQDFSDLVKILVGNQFLVQIETNGTIFHPHYIYQCATIVCSPKGNASVYPAILPFINIWKYLIMDGDPAPKLQHENIPRDCVYIQPIDEGDIKRNMANMTHAALLCKIYGYRLSLQIHKICGLQ